MEVNVPSNLPSVPVMRVSAGETWSFSASGQWTNGFITCGPDGYRNFLADALQMEPLAAGHPWFRLMGRIKGAPDSTFPIGTGCTRTFGAAGDLVVFANDSADGYANNKGAVTLTALPGGVAPAVGQDVGFIGSWHRFRDVFSRTQGIPVIAALVLGVSWILVFMRQGQDLIRGVGEDNFWQFPSGLLQIAFAVGLLFLALQAWSWSRLVVTSNYGPDRDRWRPRRLLVWTPRVLGGLPFAAAAVALWFNPASNSYFVFVLILLGLAFFIFVINRQDIERRAAAATPAGGPTRPNRFQRRWVVFSLLGAGVSMVLATLFPAHFGVWLGAPAVVFLGLGFIIPVIVVVIQLGASLRIPVVGALLVARSFSAYGPTITPWDGAPSLRRRPAPPSAPPSAKRMNSGERRSGAARLRRRPWSSSPCRAARRGPATGRRLRSRACAKRPGRKASTSTRISLRSVRCRAAASARSATRGCFDRRRTRLISS